MDDCKSFLKSSSRSFSQRPPNWERDSKLFLHKNIQTDVFSLGQVLEESFVSQEQSDADAWWSRCNGKRVCLEAQRPEFDSRPYMLKKYLNLNNEQQESKAQKSKERWNKRETCGKRQQMQ